MCLVALKDRCCHGFLVTLGGCRYLNSLEQRAPLSTSWWLCGGSGGGLWGALVLISAGDCEEQLYWIHGCWSMKLINRLIGKHSCQSQIWELVELVEERQSLDSLQRRVGRRQATKPCEKNHRIYLSPLVCTSLHLLFTIAVLVFVYSSTI